MDYGSPDMQHWISTHAPLAGRDHDGLSHYIMERYFNPRAPCGARQTITRENVIANLFQPTRPLRGATAFEYSIEPYYKISTHAPLAGRDQQ